MLCWTNLQTAALKWHWCHVRYLKNSCSVTKFLSVIELSGGTAQDSVYLILLISFYCIVYLLINVQCISVAINGATVMTGVRSCVTTRFSQNNPYIIDTLYTTWKTWKQWVVMGIGYIFKIDNGYTNIDQWSIIGDNYLLNVFTDNNFHRCNTWHQIDYSRQ